MNIYKAIGTIEQFKAKKQKNWYGLFIDIKMAFDTASHKIIINELQKTKISNSTLNVIKLLLNSYQTSMNGKELIKIKRGVP